MEAVKEFYKDPRQHLRLLARKVGNPLTTAELAASITEVNDDYLPGQIERYGAVVDGVTDDTLAIRRAVSQASQGGAPVILPAGDILMETVTTFDVGLIDGCVEVGSNVHIRGQGLDTRIIGSKSVGTDANGYAIFVVRGGDNIVFSDFLVDGVDRTTNRGIGIAIVCRAPSSTDITVNNCHAREVRSTAFFFAQGVTSLSAPVVTRLTVDGLTVDGANGHGLAIEGCDYVNVSNVHARNCIAASFTGLGVDVSDGNNQINLNNVTIENCEGGLKVEADTSASLPSFNANINNIIFRGGADTVTYGLRILCENFNASNIHLLDCEDYALDIAGDDNQCFQINGLIVRGVNANTDSGRPFRIINNNSSGGITERKYSRISNFLFEDCAAAGNLRTSGIQFVGGEFDNFVGDTNAVDINNDANTGTTDTYDNISFTDVDFGDTRGVVASGKTVSTVDYGSIGLRFTGCKFDNTTTGGINVTFGEDLTVVGCDIKTTGALSDAIDVNGVNGFTLVGNRLNATRYGVNITNAATDNGLIVGNVITAGTDIIRTQATVAMTASLFMGNLDVSGTGYTFSGTGHSLQTYSASNVTTDRTFDANTVAIAELADVVGTLIADLRAQGLVI